MYCVSCGKLLQEGGGFARAVGGQALPQPSGPLYLTIAGMLLGMPIVGLGAFLLLKTYSMPAWQLIGFQTRYGLELKDAAILIFIVGLALFMVSVMLYMIENGKRQ